MILPMRPSSTASYSIVALSVSISAMTSPEWTSSPSFLSQRATAPSVIVGDSAGMRIWMDISAIRHFAGRGDDVLDLRHREAFEIGGVGQRHVLAGDALHRRVEPVEAFFHHHRRELRADAGEGPAFFDRDEPVGLFD